MALNYIFIAFFGLAFLAAILRVFGYLFRDFLLDSLGWIFDSTDLLVFNTIVQSTFDAAQTSMEIIIRLIGIMALWLGIMKVGEHAGLIEWLSKKISPFMRLIFPEVPAGHPAQSSMVMNFAANMLGLDNAATPFGLKAMEDLQSINPSKSAASDAQIMFLVLNTSGLTLIPVSVIALRAANGASEPTEVFIPILLATTVATIFGLLIVSIRQGINLFQPRLILTIAGFLTFIALSIWGLSQLPRAMMQNFTDLVGNFLLFAIIVAFFIAGWRKGINVYTAFIEGAKEGFSMGVTIIPYLVGMLVAIGVFRASGFLDLIISGIEYAVISVGFDAEFVKALPTAFMKPLSGSGARGAMLETMEAYGPDSFAATLSGIFQGSTETTFYTIAVYYGAVRVKNIRYTAGAGLAADLAGIIAAILIGYFFFG
jgi:spore maturation protein SpmA